MKRFTTCALIAAAGLFVTTSADAALVVAADYTFDAMPGGAAVNGDAAVAGGSLVLDGDGDYITLADPLAGASDNFVMEATFTTGDSLPGFSFAAARNAGTTNNGFGILVQGDVLGLNSGIGPFGGGVAAAVNTTYTVSFVRQDGTSSVWINGVLQAGTLDPISAVGVDTLAIGAHNFDAPNGLLNGSVDRVRLSTIGANDQLGVGQDGFLEVVPEPGSLALLGLGGLALLRRRRA